MSNSELLLPLEGQSNDDLQSLRERVSELDEQVMNLKRLEGTLQRNYRMFESLLAASQDGIALTGPDGTIIRVIKSVMGYGSKLLTGVSIFDVVHPEDQAAMRECYLQLVRHHVRQVHHEIRVWKEDGSVAWIEGTVSDMLDDPNVLAIVHNFRDITQRKAAENTLLELAAVVAQAPFAFFSKDMEGNIQSWNSGAELLFGYTADEIIGQHIWKLVPPEIHYKEAALRAAVIQNGTPMGPLPTVRLHKNGSHLPVEITLIPLIRDGRVRGIVHLSQALGAKEPPRVP
jgi:PAS domain S-box-containing protein